jgi:hypothetical protein
MGHATRANHKTVAGRGGPEPKPENKRSRINAERLMQNEISCARADGLYGRGESIFGLTISNTMAPIGAATSASKIAKMTWTATTSSSAGCRAHQTFPATAPSIAPTAAPTSAPFLKPV